MSNGGIEEFILPTWGGDGGAQRYVVDTVMEQSVNQMERTQEGFTEETAHRWVTKDEQEFSGWKRQGGTPQLEESAR